MFSVLILQTVGQIGLEVHGKDKLLCRSNTANSCESNRDRDEFS